MDLSTYKKFSQGRKIFTHRSNAKMFNFDWLKYCRRLLSKHLQRQSSVLSYFKGIIDRTSKSITCSKRCWLYFKSRFFQTSQANSSCQQAPNRFNSFHANQIPLTHSILYSLFAILFPLYSLFCILYSIPSARAEDSPVSATVPSTSTPDDTTPPTSPILLRPVDGSTIGDSTPEFVWRKSTDINSNTIHYNFYLDNVATYLSVSNDGSSGGIGYIATIDSTEVRLTPTTALPDGKYTWKVVAYDNAGNLASSTSWSFTIDTLAPFLTLTKLDNIANPVINEESSFEFIGPKTVLFTILSEPYASIRLALTSSLQNVKPLILTASTNQTGLASFSPYLKTGLYSVSISATDQVNLVSVLPTFTLSITPAPLPILTTLPATVSQITASSTLFTITLLLFIILLFLFLFFRRRRPNLILLDSKGNPINHALITHSRPFISRNGNLSTSYRHSSPYYSLLTTYYKSHIPYLTRYSTLTIRLQEPNICTVTVLSLCTKSSSYTIIL